MISSSFERGITAIGIVVGLALPLLGFATDSASLGWQGAEFIPTMGVTQQYRDNVLFQDDNHVSSAVSILRPQLQVLLERSRLLMDGRLRAEVGRYSKSAEDDYEDTSAQGTLNWDINQRNTLTINGTLELGHEDRGTGYSTGLFLLGLDQPDTLKTRSVGGTYRFGGLKAPGRLLLGVESSVIEYTSRPLETYQRNRDSLAMRATFLWRMGGRTDALAEVRNSAVDYMHDPTDQGGFGSLDSDEQSYFVGLRWEATGKTEGSIRVGQREKAFDSAARDDFSGFSWEVDASWSPKTYSTFTLKTARTPIETDGTGSFIDEQSWAIDWAHDWTNKFSSTWKVSIADREYQGSLDGREETNYSAGFSCLYSLKRWADLGLQLNRRQKSSNLEFFGYQSNLAALTLTLSL